MIFGLVRADRCLLHVFFGGPTADSSRHAFHGRDLSHDHRPTDLRSTHSRQSALSTPSLRPAAESRRPGQPQPAQSVELA
jgi:hypothetical protein